MPETQPKIIVLDDDPTGSQTVHSCLLLMQWDVETLRLGLGDDSPIFFVLTNTRARTPEAAEAITREVCENLKQAIALSPNHKFVKETKKQFFAALPSVKTAKQNKAPSKPAQRGSWMRFG